MSRNIGPEDALGGRVGDGQYAVLSSGGDLDRGQVASLESIVEVLNGGHDLEPDGGVIRVGEELIAHHDIDDVGSRVVWDNVLGDPSVCGAGVRSQGSNLGVAHPDDELQP